MTWVKICGITNFEDALLAVQTGADALGFVFCEQSPRNVGVQTARAIVERLPERVEKVGVFVDQTADEIREAVRETGMTAVQLHDAEESCILEGLGRVEDRFGVSRLILAMQGNRLSEDGLFVGLATVGNRQVHAILLDSGWESAPGGTGKTFDWKRTHEVARGLSFKVPFIVAGGLTPSNVSEAIGLFRPWGVDVSSGVEARPGRKDPEKVRAFIRIVRETDGKTS
jgi:phosphoribosylanthranilate isomerase